MDIDDPHDEWCEVCLDGRKLSCQYYDYARQMHGDLMIIPDTIRCPRCGNRVEFLFKNMGWK